MEYLLSTKLNILNRGNKTTIVISNGKELGTDKIGDGVSTWHISDEISLSDHRFILFQLCDEVTRVTSRTRVPTGNPIKNTHR